MARLEPPGLRQELLRSPSDEVGLLFAADLDQGQMGEAGIGELGDGLEVAVDVGPAGDLVGDVVLGDQLRGGGEAGGSRELGVDLPAAGEPAELLVGPPPSRLLVDVVAHRHLPVGRLAGPAGFGERGQQLRLGLHRDDQVGQFPGD